MIFTRRFGALAARRTFNDRPEVVTLDKSTERSDVELQHELEEYRDDAVA